MTNQMVISVAAPLGTKALTAAVRSMSAAAHPALKEEPARILSTDTSVSVLMDLLVRGVKKRF